MNLQYLLKPTKEKLYSFTILILGLSLPKIANFFITIFAARTFGPEKYAEYLMFRTSNVLFILATLIIYCVWIYLLVTIIVNICEKSSCKNSAK
jgi:hypothetical protein